MEDEITLDFTPEGTASTPWYSQEIGEIMEALGPPAPGYEDLNSNPYCG